MNKNILREEMRRLRRELTASEVSEKSRLIQNRVMSLPEFQSAKTVMLYISAFKEPSTAQILSSLILAGKKAVVPVSDTETETIILSYTDGTFKKGAYGILEPKTVIPAPRGEIDIVLVPALAFDRCGNRLGFGKGYYDKLLCGLRAEKIGICYEFQVFDEIPHEPHDILMNKIITEEKVYAV